jgi:ParB-like chromosome segregation protein Spo0J
MPAPKNGSLIVEEWSIDRPIAYARNARKIPKAAVDKVAASIKEFGWRQPIVVDKDGVIVVGHARLLAAKKLKLQSVPVHVAADLTPEQIKAYRLADNRTGEETDWDYELLVMELKELEDLVGLTLATGFDLAEIERLTAAADPAGEQSASTEVQEKFEVIVLCKNEQQQAAAIELLQEKGFECRALIA